MLSVMICRCSHPLRGAPSKLLFNGPQSKVVTRELITSASLKNNGFQLTQKVSKIRDLVKSRGILARFCSSPPKPKPSKVVGYWLLGCSGMVFTAVVLGMVSGYLILLYSIYYVVNVILSSTNGSK